MVEINSNGKSMSGVSIEAVSSDDVQPAVSGNDGVFILNFAKKKRGDVAYNIRVYKLGYELVNTKQINDGVILTDRDTLKVVLAPPAKLAEARANYYEIFDNYQVGVYKKQIEELKSQLAKNEIPLAEYEQRALKAEEDLRNANSKIAEYADRFSRINRDDMDSVGRRAFAALDAGDIEGALKVYSDFNSLERLSRKIEQRNEANASISEMIPGMYEEIELRLLVGGKENRRVVGQMFDKIVESDTTNVEYLRSAVRFFCDEMEIDKVFRYGRMAERNCDDSPILAIVFTYVGRSCKSINDYKNASHYFEKSIELIDAARADGMEEKDYLNLINTPLHSLGIMYYQAYEFEKSEQTIRKSVEVRRRLSEIDPYYDGHYANSLSCIAIVLSDQMKFDEAMAAIDKAIEIEKRIYPSNPNQFAPLLAHFCTLKSNICMKMKEFGDAKELLAEALDIYDRHELLNCYLNLYMLAVLNLAKSEYNLHEYDEAEANCDRLVGLCETYDDGNGIYTDYNAGALLCKGDVLYQKGKFAEALDNYIEGKKLIEPSVDRIKRFKADMPKYLVGIGKSYLSLNDRKNAEDSYLAAFSIVKELYDAEPNNYQMLYETVNGEMADFYRKIGKKRMAKRYEGIGERLKGER
ncbi:MAG: tetratricopeptide repeat protein [Bacteroidales bacterium]|nr:tetratricopeptide repeat protein [Bacteroidales bacterium]